MDSIELGNGECVQTIRIRGNSKGSHHIQDGSHNGSTICGQHRSVHMEGWHLQPDKVIGANPAWSWNVKLLNVTGWALKAKNVSGTHSTTNVQKENGPMPRWYYEKCSLEIRIEAKAQYSKKGYHGGKNSAILSANHVKLRSKLCFQRKFC